MEGFGLAVLEAGIHGLSVVASDLEGLRDSVVDGENGWRLMPEDEEAFSRQLSELIAEASGASDERRLRAQQFVQQRFSWRNVIRDYMEVIDEAARSGA